MTGATLLCTLLYIEYNHENVVKSLLSHKASSCVENIAGNTALDITVLNNNKHLRDLMIAGGAKCSKNNDVLNGYLRSALPDITVEEFVLLLRAGLNSLNAFKLRSC